MVSRKHVQREFSCERGVVSLSVCLWHTLYVSGNYHMVPPTIVETERTASFRMPGWLLPRLLAS